MWTPVALPGLVVAALAFVPAAWRRDLLPEDDFARAGFARVGLKNLPHFAFAEG